MKRIPTSEGPFSTRLYFTDEEIEQLCSKALAETNLLPNKPQPIRIDRFIDKKFDVPIIYEPIKGMLGFTEFSPKGIEAIHIAEPDGDLWVQQDRRVNSTLAHEAGHCLMHTELFIERFANQKLFKDHPDVTQTAIFCRDELPNTRTKQQGYSGRWWEFQANRAIGALLLPNQLFVPFMKPFLGGYDTHLFSDLPIKAQQEAIKAASRVFEVNEMVVRVRLQSQAS